jgi:hypothetical protein
MRYRTVRYHSIPWLPAPANLQSFPRCLQAIDPLTRTSDLQSFIRRAPDENRRASFFFTHPSRLVQRLPTNSQPSPSHKAFVGGFVNSPHHIFLRLGPFLCSTASCLGWALSVNSLIVHALSPPRLLPTVLRATSRFLRPWLRAIANEQRRRSVSGDKDLKVSQYESNGVSVVSEFKLFCLHLGDVDCGASDEAGVAGTNKLG